MLLRLVLRLHLLALCVHIALIWVSLQKGVPLVGVVAGVQQHRQLRVGAGARVLGGLRGCVARGDAGYSRAFGWSSAPPAFVRGEVASVAFAQSSPDVPTATLMPRIAVVNALADWGFGRFEGGNERTPAQILTQ